MNPTRRMPRWIGASLCLAMTASPAVAQLTPGPVAQSAVTIGASNLTIGAVSFLPTESSAQVSYDGNGGKYATSPSGATLAASFSLPTGTLVSVLEFEVYDNDPISDVTMTARLCSGDPPGTPCTSLGSVTTSGTPGWGYLFFGPSGNSEGFTINNLTNQYLVEVTLPFDAGATAFRRVTIFCSHQVSPAPTDGTSFNDVPATDPGFQYIEALAQSGLTRGCGGLNFCPDSPVTRRQLAVFLAKALGLSWPN